MFFHSRRGLRSASHEREQLQTVEKSVHTRHRPDEIVEVAALSALENALHEKRRQVEHCVRVLNRGKEKMRVLEECAVVLTSRAARTPWPTQCMIYTSAANS